MKNDTANANAPDRAALLEWMSEKGVSASAVAEDLSRMTGRRVHVSTVQRWIAGREKGYGRGLPGWVMPLLSRDNGEAA